MPWFCFLNWNDQWSLNTCVILFRTHVRVGRRQSMALLVLILNDHRFQCQNTNAQVDPFIHKRKPVRILFYSALAHVILHLRPKRNPLAVPYLSVPELKQAPGNVLGQKQHKQQTKSYRTSNCIRSFVRVGSKCFNSFFFFSFFFLQIFFIRLRFEVKKA